MPEYRPVPSEETVPEPPELLELTTAQQGVRYGQLVDPDSPKYNIGECLEIRGGLDEELFTAVVDRVVHLCDSLNTVLVEEDGRVRQRVARPAAVRRRARVVDLTGADDPSAAAERYMARDMAAVDRVEAPSHHWALLRLGPELHYWYVRYHHIAMDGLSGALVARAVADLYTRVAAGADLETAAVAPGGALGALVADEGAYLASERFGADRDYWVGRFAGRGDSGGGTLLRRRTDAGPADAAAAGGALHTGGTLPLPVFDGLRRLAAENRTTWSAVLVAAVAADAARVSGRREVCVGLASHGRPGGLREAVGMTATVLPLPLAVEPGATVGGLVRAVAAEMRGALRHRRFSREQLARELNLADGGTRLTDLVVNIMGYGYGLDFAGSRASSRVLSIGPVDDVSLWVAERAEEGTGPLLGFAALACSK